MLKLQNTPMLAHSAARAAQLNNVSYLTRRRRGIAQNNAQLSQRPYGSALGKTRMATTPIKLKFALNRKINQRKRSHLSTTSYGETKALLRAALITRFTERRIRDLRHAGRTRKSASSLKPF